MPLISSTETTHILRSGSPLVVSDYPPSDVRVNHMSLETLVTEDSDPLVSSISEEVSTEGYADEGKTLRTTTIHYEDRLDIEFFPNYDEFDQFSYVSETWAKPSTEPMTNILVTEVPGKLLRDGRTTTNRPFPKLITQPREQLRTPQDLQASASKTRDSQEILTRDETFVPIPKDSKHREWSNQILISSSNDVIDFSLFRNMDEELLAMESDRTNPMQSRTIPPLDESEKNNIRLYPANTIDILTSASTPTKPTGQPQTSNQFNKRKLKVGDDDAKSDSNQRFPNGIDADEQQKRYKISPNILKERERKKKNPWPREPKIKIFNRIRSTRPPSTTSTVETTTTTLTTTATTPLTTTTSVSTETVSSTTPKAQGTDEVTDPQLEEKDYQQPGRRLDYIRTTVGDESIEMNQSESERNLLAGMDIPVQFTSQTSAQALKRKSVSKRVKMIMKVFDENFRDLETTLRLNAIPHLSPHVDAKNLNRQPKMAVVGSGQKMGQDEFFVYYVTLIEIQKVLEEVLKKDLNPEIKALFMDLSSHNFELMKLFFKHIVITDKQSKVLLNQKDSRTFKHHFNALREIFPFL